MLFMKRTLLLSFSAALAFAPFVLAQNRPDSLKTFGGGSTIDAAGAKIPAGWPLYVTAGTTAGMNGGSTVRDQARTTLSKLQQNISTAGFGLSDVAFVRAYVVPDATGKVNFAGWDEAWREMFGNAKTPHKPARTTIAVPRLGTPETLIEIEFVCSAPARDFSSSDKLGLPAANPVLKPYGTKEARIYDGVGALANTAFFWTSGQRGAGQPPNFGDMKTQAYTGLQNLKNDLAAAGLTFKDVVFLRAFVGPDKPGAPDARYDLANWNAAYDEFFNNSENPHKPARTTVTVPNFGGAGPLIEIEIVAAFPSKSNAVTFSAANGNAHITSLGAPTAAIASGVATDRAPSMYFSAATGPKAGTPPDLKAQAVSAFESLGERLKAAGLGYKDVVFLRLYIVPEKDGSVDRKARDEAYATFFNNAKNPHKPARTTISVSALPVANWKIAMDAVAVAP
jgi:enamine deaminase RidA (YjgF/YER057c/UK114 family)